MTVDVRIKQRQLLTVTVTVTVTVIVNPQPSMHPIHLTFDDGPDSEWTPRILDVLAAAQVSATFFAIGEQVRRTPALVRRVLAEGHAIGNHTFSHRHPWLMSSRAARAEVRDGAKALSDATGQAPRLFRPPHGRRRACMSDQAAQQGEQIVMWDVSAIDWGPLATAHRIEQRLAQAKAGDILLMHDGRNRHNRPDELLRALPGVLAAFTGRGLHATQLQTESDEI